MCEAQNITVQGQPPNPLDSLPTNLSLGNSTIPETSLPESLQHPAPPRGPRLSYRNTKQMRNISLPFCRGRAPLCQPSSGMWRATVPPS